MKIIRVYRQAAGMTIGELAKASGVNRTTVSYAERGGHRLNLATLEKIGGVLGISVSDLLFADEVLARKQAVEKDVNEYALSG